jgi:hypothetical protein
MDMKKKFVTTGNGAPKEGKLTQPVEEEINGRVFITIPKIVP